MKLACIVSSEPVYGSWARFNFEGGFRLRTSGPSRYHNAATIADCLPPGQDYTTAFMRLAPGHDLSASIE